MLKYTLIPLALLWSAHATPTGNHTCTGVVKHEVTVRVNVTEPVTFRAYEWCLRVPPRCSTYTIQLKDRVKIHRELHNRTITVCCKGYVEIDYKCVPACPPETECPNMHCNRTNHCYCTPGYTGLYCNHPCPKGVWGAGCIKPCDCPAGYTCHHLTGDCMIDDSPPSKTRRTTTASELLTETATTLMTTHSTTQAPTISTTTRLTTTSTTTTTLPPTTTTSTTTSTTRSPTTTTTTTTERPTTISSTTTVQGTTPEPTEPTINRVIPTSTTTTTTPPPSIRTSIKKTTTTTQQPAITSKKMMIMENIEHSTTSTTQPQMTEELSTMAPTTEATTVTTTQITTVTSKMTSVMEPTTPVPTTITEIPTTTSTTAPERINDIIPSTTTTENRYINDVATSRTTGLTAVVTEQQPTVDMAAEEHTEQYKPPETTKTTMPVVLDRESTPSPVAEETSAATKQNVVQTEPSTTTQEYITPSTITVIYTTPTMSTVLYTSPTTATEQTMTTFSTEEPTTTQETTTTQQATTVTQTPFVEVFTTKQMTTATQSMNAATTEESPTEKMEDLRELDREIHFSTSTKTQVNDSLDKDVTDETATPRSITDARTAVRTSTLLPAGFGNSKSTNTDFHEGSGQIIEEIKYEKGRGFNEIQSSTTDRLDRLIIEDVPKAPPPELTSDENPIKLVEEVISKYFPDTFKKAAVGQTNKTEPSVMVKNKEKDEKPWLPPWKIGKENSDGREVEGLEEAGFTKSEDVVKPTRIPTTQQPTTVTTPSTTTVASTIPVITPKVIVSAKNPDEIDLGGVIYRKMKLFRPVKPPTDDTTVPALGVLVDVTPSKGDYNKEATSPAGDRFKIYLPNYDKEVMEFETTETPNVKTFLPKFNFDKEEFDYGKQAQAKKAKQKEKESKKYKVKPHEVTNAPVDDGSNERVTNNVFLETKEFKVHLASTKAQKFGESYYTKAPIDQDSPVYDLNKLAKKKGKFGSSEYEPTKYGKHMAENQDFDEATTTQGFLETNNPTTNPKPPHTWYSHAREKAKIKSALKTMKSTMTLDMNVKPTLDSLMEESNDIHSMATQYTEREPRSAVTYQDDLNNPQMFGQVKFNAPEGYAAAVSESETSKVTRLGILTSVAVGGACFMAMASLVAVLWLRLKTRWSQMRKTESDHGPEDSPRPVATTSNYETVYPVHRETDEIEAATFFCPTFTNNYAERINREFREMSYDHPKSNFTEPLYAEILHPKIRVLEEEQ